MMRERRSVPISTLSFALSKSSMKTTFLLTRAADGVDLVDEDDARGILLPLLEEVADARGADADEHLDEVGSRDREEGNVGLAGDRPGQERLAGARRPHQQHALRDLSAQLLEP